LKDVIDLIKSAKSCIFLTSAGMSAESGIPTFRDKEGYWHNFPAYKKLNLEAVELANPRSFAHRPEHAWAFYEWRRRNAHTNKPHDGYKAINKLISNHFEYSFVHTTNTDGYHLISGIPEDKVYEIHGSMWRLQCSRGDSCSYNVKDDHNVPLCELDTETMTSTNLPKCPNCNQLLRPNILLFGDFDYIENEKQANNFRSFLNQAGIPEITFLIGASGTVPTNDYLAVRLQKAGSKVITINPDADSTKVCTPDIFLKTGAKDALTTIANELGLSVS
jgi:NAD-dependent SIR2 family protein deacetylase